MDQYEIVVSDACEIARFPNCLEFYLTCRFDVRPEKEESKINRISCWERNFLLLKPETNVSDKFQILAINIFRSQFKVFTKSTISLTLQHWQNLHNANRSLITCSSFTHKPRFFILDFFRFYLPWFPCVSFQMDHDRHVCHFLVIIDGEILNLEEKSLTNLVS